MREKEIVFTARLLSKIFNPLYLPIVGLIILFIFSYLSLLPWTYKIKLIAVFWLFTVYMPSALIRIYRNYHGWAPIQLGKKERRAIPYAISIICYLLCCYLMTLWHVPRFMGSILIAALVVQIACAVTNIFIKISTHMAAIGGVTGGLIAFSLIFAFNPVWWLCLVIMFAGMVGTSRMILRQHSLNEVVSGFVLGACFSFISVVIY